MDLPRLSLSHFRNGTEKQRTEFTRQLFVNFATCGFVKLCDHGFDEEDVGDMFEWSRQFFQLPRDLRDACAHVPGPSPQRGYSRIGNENLAKFYSKWTGETPPEARRDHKELYDIGPAQDTQFPNRWPEEAAIPGFRSYMETVYGRFEKVTHDILAALEMGMNLSPGSFTNKCIQHASEFRFVHYPPITAEELRGGMVSRAWPHYDIGVISFLFQDNVGGLEMGDGRSSDGFVSVVSENPTDLIVNAAETLQRWSNGILKAGLHRVTIPRSMKEGDEGRIPERYSAVYFLKPDRTASVAPIPELVNHESPALYEDMTALEYHQRRVLAAYT